MTRPFRNRSWKATTQSAAPADSGMSSALVLDPGGVPRNGSAGAERPLLPGVPFLVPAPYGRASLTAPASPSLLPTSLPAALATHPTSRPRLRNGAATGPDLGP